MRRAFLVTSALLLTLAAAPQTKAAPVLAGEALANAVNDTNATQVHYRYHRRHYGWYRGHHYGWRHRYHRRHYY